MPVHNDLIPAGREYNRKKRIAILILSSLTLYLFGCAPTSTPEPSAANSYATASVTLPITQEETHRSEIPTQQLTTKPQIDPTAAPLILPSDEPTAEPLSTRTPPPTTTQLPTGTPDLHLPPDDSALGTIWYNHANGMDLVFVPGGTFAMGSDESNIEMFHALCEQERGEGKCWLDWFDDEQPVRDITLADFWIQRTEVTNSQYAAFLNELGNQRENEAEWFDIENPRAQIVEENGSFHAISELADHPVIAVTWHGADAFCAWHGAVLPTEAQWEYAARGEESRPFPWGGAELTCDLARYSQCVGQSVPVDSHVLGASWNGALNMAGNVWEWVADWYDSGAYMTSELVDPLGPPLGKSKVLRGGGWETQSYDLRSTNRSFGDPKFAADVIGFRCVVPGS